MVSCFSLQLRLPMDLGKEDWSAKKKKKKKQSRRKRSKMAGTWCLYMLREVSDIAFMMSSTYGHSFLGLDCCHPHFDWNLTRSTIK